jgi:hypothetical protein
MFPLAACSDKTVQYVHMGGCSARLSGQARMEMNKRIFVNYNGCAKKVFGTQKALF